MKDVKKVVAQLRKEGAELVNNVVVKNVAVKDMDNYTRVSLTLNKEVKKMITNGKGDQEEGTGNVIFASSYSIGAILSNNEDVAFAKNLIMESPQLLAMVLSYAQVDILLEHVAKGQEYTNPFSSKDDSRVVERDSIYYHVIDIRLSKKGLAIVEKLEDRMLNDMMSGVFGKVAAGANTKDKDED